jgi:hypothetical protein
MVYMAAYLALASALLSVVSCAAFFWAASVPSPIKKHPSGFSGGILLDDDPSVPMNVFGMVPVTYEQSRAHEIKVSGRNRIGAILSAVAALFALASAVWSFF